MRKIFLILLFSGIILRFFTQFIFPVFNGDEISLGNNIKHSSFIELLYPLKYGQSSPPLFLLIQKLIVTISPLHFWINVKILSFISSTLGIIFFYIFIKRNNYKFIFLLPFIILLFNPFNISNSLTLKQYTIDLTGIIILVTYFKTIWFKKYNWIFFMIWCLMSNIGLFACAAYIIFMFIDSNIKMNLSEAYIFFKKKLLSFTAPVPYIIYFIWFMKQDGTQELKEFMLLFWHNSFIPLNSTIFKYTLYTIHSLWIFMFNAFEIWGIFLMLLTIPFFISIKRKGLIFRDEILLLSIILLIHLVFNLFHLYPFAERLYLYLTPLFILILGASLEILFASKYLRNYFSKISILIAFTTVFLYSLYNPCNDNDVFGLYEKFKKLRVNTIYATEKSISNFNNFDVFTDNVFNHNFSFVSVDSKLDKSKYLISRVSKKIKMNSTSPEEPLIEKLIQIKKIKKVDQVNGYNIYEIMQ